MHVTIYFITNLRGCKLQTCFKNVGINYTCCTYFGLISVQIDNSREKKVRNKRAFIVTKGKRNCRKNIRTCVVFGNAKIHYRQDKPFFLLKRFSYIICIQYSHKFCIGRFHDVYIIVELGVDKYQNNLWTIIMLF